MAISWSTASASPEPGDVNKLREEVTVGMVFQSFWCVSSSSLTVLDNITWPPEGERALSARRLRSGPRPCCSRSVSNKAQSYPPSSPAASSSGWPSPGARHAAAHHVV